MTTRNILSGGGSPDPSPAPPGGDDGGTSGSGGAGGAISWGGGGKLRVAPDPERDLACCRLPLTDLGNAERWRVRHGQDFRFCAEIGWFAWDGRRWKLLSEERDRLPARVMQTVFATVRAIRNEAALVAASGYEPVVGLTDKEQWQLERFAEAHGVASRESYLVGDDDGERARWLEQLDPLDTVLDHKKGTLWSSSITKWAKTSEGAGKIDAVARLAKSFADIAIQPDALDADRMAINVLNGTLRIERNKVKRSSEDVAAGKSEWKVDGWRVKLHKHDRADLMTKLAPVKYAPSATCPLYDAFIAQVQPDETMRRFIHQWGGYSLTGDIGEHKMVFFHGGGRNGKGTWVELVAHIAGDFAGSVGIESIAEQKGERRGDQATPDIARLPGVRFLRVSEPKKGMAFNDGLIKQLTGGDPVDARHLNKGFFTFLPSFKLTVSGNNKPVVRDLSHGMWARMQLVPWEVTLDESQIDRGLGDKLKAEESGVLNRLIEGLLDWKTNGLIVPEQVRLATRGYRDDSDDVGRFLSALCVVSDDKDHVRVGARFLWQLYTAWAEHAGGSKIGERAFKGSMEEKRFEQKQSDGMKWLGIQPRDGVSLEDVQRGVWPRADQGPSAVDTPPPEWPSGEGADWVPDDDPPIGLDP